MGSKGASLIAVQREDLTIDSKKGRSLAIADNRASEIDLDWDPEMLASLDLNLHELFDDNDLRRIMGDLASKLEAPEPQLDQAAALQKKWKTARGQIWKIDEHRLMCGDSTSERDVAALPFLPVAVPVRNRSPQGVNCDPNWRNKEAAKGNLAYAARRVGKVSNDHRVDWTPAWKLFPGHVLYCWHAGRYASTVQESIENADFEIRSQIIWAKSNFPISRGHYHWRHEPCWYAVRSGATAQSIGDRAKTTLLRRPVLHQFTRNDLLQLALGGQLARLGPQGRLRSLLIGFTGSIERPPAMAGDLSAYCGSTATQTLAEDPHRAAAVDTAGDVFPLGQRQCTPAAATCRRSDPSVTRQQEMDDLFIFAE